MNVDFLLSIVDFDPENSQIYSYVTLHLVPEITSGTGVKMPSVITRQY